MKLNRKNKILILGFCLVLYLCYSLAITNTIKYYNALKSKEFTIENSIQFPSLIPQLKHKEEQLDKYIKSNEIMTKASLQNELLKQLITYSKVANVKITNFQEPHYTLKNNKIKVTSYIFSLEGTFNNCLKTINTIENECKLGTIKHLHFIKTTNYKTHNNELNVEIIIQNNSSIKI